MTRDRTRSPSFSSSEGSCYTLSMSGREASSGVRIEDMLESLHLDPDTHVLNKLKLRCLNADVPVGGTKAECKQVRKSQC